MKGTRRLYVDFHVLQTVPPSCVNRDDTGSPKTAIYGGVTRARVSSQAWKHAMREMFRDQLLSGDKLGKRTKKIVSMVEGEIRKLSAEIAEPEKKAVEALKKAGVTFKDAKNNTAALFFMSQQQAVELAKLAVAGESDKKKYKAALKETPSVDMALFGRMVADDPSLNYDAAAQVAHSISTHGVQNEYDYFTALDDCQAEDNAGAGHLDTVEFNSATLYRYATVNGLELAKHLGKEDAVAALVAFAEAFICSMPTGKQNTFANRTLPDAVYITIREDQPVNLCGAFEKPVAKSTAGYVAESRQRLANYAKEVYENFVAEPVMAMVVGKEMSELGTVCSVVTALDLLEKAVAERLQGVDA